MKRVLICAFACHLMLASIAPAQDNPLAAMWPFGKDKKSTANAGFNNINPFTSPTTPAKEDKLFALPSPMKMIDKAGDATGAMVQKTKDTWKGIGKSLNPFASKSKKPKQRQTEKRSMFSRLLPKPKEAPAPTMGEFLTMKRPGF